MKLIITAFVLLVLAGCQSQLTPEEEKKLQRMNEVMKMDGGGVKGTNVNTPGGGHNPAKTDGAIEL